MKSGERAEVVSGQSFFWKHLWWIAILASLALKLASLNSRELWLDEMYSAYVAHLPLADVLRFAAGDQHPPLFLVLLWGWVHAFGDTMGRLRLFSLLINLVAMVCTFIVGRRILGRRSGAVAAVLFSLSPIVFVYALEVRSYMLLMLVFIILLGLHWRVVVERSNSIALLVAYAACAALSFYVHYFALFALTGLALHALSSPAYWRGRVQKLAMVAGLVLLLVLPQVPSLLAKRNASLTLNNARTSAHSNPDALSYGSADSYQETGLVAYAKPALVLAGFYPARSPLLLLLFAIPVAAALASIIFLALFRRDPLCMLSCLVVMCVEFGVMKMHLPATKYALLVVPVCVLALARAMQYWSNTVRWHTLGVICGACLIAVYGGGFYRQFSIPQAHPWLNVFNTVQKSYKSGDIVVFDALYAQVPFDYFGRQQHFYPLKVGFPITEYAWWDEQPCKAWGGPVITQLVLDRFVNDLEARKPRTIYLVLYETAYYDPAVKLQGKLGEFGLVTDMPLPFQQVGDALSNGGLHLVRIDMNQDQNRNPAPTSD